MAIRATCFSVILSPARPPGLAPRHAPLGPLHRSALFSAGHDRPGGRVCSCSHFAICWAAAMSPPTFSSNSIAKMPIFAGAAPAIWPRSSSGPKACTSSQIPPSPSTWRSGCGLAWTICIQEEKRVQDSVANRESARQGGRLGQAAGCQT